MVVPVQSGFNVSPSEAVYQFSDGMEDVVTGFITFPSHTVKYVLGVDQHFGQDAQWSGIFRNYYGWEDGLCRAPWVFNHALFGAINTVTGGFPHLVVNQWLGIDTDFFAPPPRDWQELARYLTGTFFISVGIRYGRVVRADQETALQREALVAAARTQARPVVRTAPPPVTVPPDILAARAVKGQLPHPQIVAILSTPSPDLIPFIRTWLILKPATLVADLEVLARAIIQSGSISDDAVYVLSALARQKTNVAGVLSKLLQEMPQYDAALVRLIHDNPDLWPYSPWKRLAEHAGARRGGVVSKDIVALMTDVVQAADPAMKDALVVVERYLRELEPDALQSRASVAPEVTMVDLRAGREATIVQEILSEARTVLPADIARLEQFVRMGVASALDALFKLATRDVDSELAQLSADAIRRIQGTQEARHHGTAVIMAGVLDQQATAPVGVVPVLGAGMSGFDALVRQILLNPRTSQLPVSQLIEAAARGNAEAMAALEKIFSVQSPHLWDVLAQEIVRCAEQGTLPLDRLQMMVSYNPNPSCAAAIVRELTTAIETRHAPSLEPMQLWLDQQKSQ